MFSIVTTIWSSSHLHEYTQQLIHLSSGRHFSLKFTDESFNLVCVILHITQTLSDEVISLIHCEISAISYNFFIFIFESI
jgi:hypothetical protein